MPQQAVLDVLSLQRLTQQRVRAQVQHAGGEIVAGAPVGVHFSQLIGGQRLEMSLPGCRVGSRYGKCLDVAHSSSCCCCHQSLSICRTCTAIIRSSWAVTTQIATSELGALTRRNASPPASLAAASSSTPQDSSPRKISARDCTSCSPMPPVKTRASSPPSSHT